MPIFASGDGPDLGPRSPKSGRDLIPTREISAFTAIKREAKRCRRCRQAVKQAPEWLAEQVMIMHAQQHHKALFRRYQVECAKWTKDFPAVIQEMPAWAAAYRAAVAHAALETPDSPMGVFAAGAYLEQQRILTWIARTLLPRATRKDRLLFEEGVNSGKFPALEAIVLRRARGKAAKGEQEERKKTLLPVWRAVRDEIAALAKNGASVTKAVKTICADGEARRRIQKIASGLRERRPWRGDFYSEREVWRMLRNGARAEPH
jgi:hypothetical protein